MLTGFSAKIIGAKNIQAGGSALLQNMNHAINIEFVELIFVCMYQVNFKFIKLILSRYIKLHQLFGYRYFWFLEKVVLSKIRVNQVS